MKIAEEILGLISEGNVSDFFKIPPLNELKTRDPFMTAEEEQTVIEIFNRIYDTIRETFIPSSWTGRGVTKSGNPIEPKITVVRKGVYKNEETDTTSSSVYLVYKLIGPPDGEVEYTIRISDHITKRKQTYLFCFYYRNPFRNQEILDKNNHIMYNTLGMLLYRYGDKKEENVSEEKKEDYERLLRKHGDRIGKRFVRVYLPLYKMYVELPQYFSWKSYLILLGREYGIKYLA